MKTTRRIRERGIAIYVTAVILVMAVPLVGLAIDGTMLYILKTRLQGATDGAALAAAKALARGSDDTAQVNNAKDAAVTYVKLNFPQGFFFTTDVNIVKATDVTVDLGVAHQRTITVTAHVSAPTLFMRFLNYTSTNINASATTVRKDSNIMLVLDRSGSMSASSSCDPMKQGAINFVANFSPGRDYVGVISFATSVVIQVPLTSTFTQASMATAIGGIACNGSTNSASALWKGYDQLVNLNQSAALNYIVFFTDGEPTGMDVAMPLTNASPCTAAPAVPPNSIPTGLPAGFTGKYLIGMMASFTNGSHFIGLANNVATPNGDGTLSSATISSSDQIIAPNSTNCSFSTSWGPSQDQSDFKGIPTGDIYGNSLATSYKSVTLNGGYVDVTNQGNGISAATNAADDAARRIRIGATDAAYGRGLDSVIIYAVGLGNASVPLPADNVFLMRVTNDPGSTANPNANYDPNYPAGRSIYVANSSDIGAAFGQIASEILRLSR